MLVLAVLVSAGVFIGRQVASGHQQRGFASKAQLAENLSAAAALESAAVIRPDLPRKAVQITDVAVQLGRAIPSRMRLFASVEHAVMLFAPPRQGKTSQVIIPWLRDWAGPALVTSVRGDVIENTLTIRRDLGPVAIIDFAREGWPYRLRWSPLAGCDSYDKARERANTMVRVGKDGAGDSTNAAFFGMTATNLLGGWMHVAAITGRTMTDVLTWALNEGDDEPIKLLADHSGANPNVAPMLEGIYAAPAETRSNMWATVMTAVAPLVGETARDVFCPPAWESFDIEAFLRERGTIYITVSEKDAADLAPLLSAFVDEVTETAKTLAERNGGRLSPPLGMILDEVANVVPLPDLATQMSTAAGSGIFIVAVFQSLAQARKRWGRDGADIMWGNATIKIALGGLSGDELDDFARLAGKYRETVTTIQRGPQGITSSPSLQDRDTITPDQIRTLSKRHREALIIEANTPAIKTRMTRHYQGPHRKQFAAARAAARALRTGGTP
ncbi:type IV secretory system conjugative DNA transfer family protein [Micromonospora sp. CA-248212]|uniref:type IV secretory system conjugative DNA transfer family protein n=1 Tax=Micromonospora sp. CA-248212 TaxID=3239961 RepID=UPI003D902CDB